MFCEECGAKLPEDARFCEACGHPVAPLVPEPAFGGAPDASVGDDACAARLEPDGSERAEIEGAAESAVDPFPSDVPVEGGCPASPSMDGPASFPDEVPVPDPLPCAQTAPLPSASPAPESDAAPGAPAAPSPSPARRRGIAIAAAAGVVVLAVIAVFLVRGMLGKRPSDIHYGSDAVVTVSRVALIVPTDDEGEPLDRYTVSIAFATDAFDDSIDLADAPTFTVSGSSGFTMDSLLGEDLPDGTYWFEVEDGDGAVRPLPPIEVTDDGSDDTVQITPAPEGEQTADGAAPSADSLYLAKLEELVGEHGNPELSCRGLDGVPVPTWQARADGLAYAELIDFGDGFERLVVAYIADDGMPDMMSSNGGATYALEVWEYDEESSEIVRSCDPIEFVNQEDDDLLSDRRLSIAEAEDGARYLVFESYVGNGGMFDEVQVYGLGEDGEFGELCTVSFDLAGHGGAPEFEGEMDSDAFSSLFRLDGADAPGSPYRTFWWSMTGESEGEAEALSSDDGAYDFGNVEVVCPAEIIAITNDTLNELEERCASEDAPQGKAVDFTAEPVEIPVTYDTYYSGLEAPDGSVDDVWTYLSVESDDANSAAADLTEEFKSRAEDLRDATESWTPDSDDVEVTISYDQACTYARDGVLGVSTQQAVTGWGAHDMVSYTGEIYDVATGDELDAWDVAGMSEDELFELAYNAVIEREQSMPSPVFAPTDEELRSELSDIIEGGGYILTEEGIELSIPHYAFGHSYADGRGMVTVLSFEA